MRRAVRPFLTVILLLALAVLAGCGESAPRPNIVIVVLDTVRDDLETLDGAGRPTLEALAAESTVFTNAWATAPWTVPSHASMFTGLLSAGHHCTHQNPKLGADKTTLAELLATVTPSPPGWVTNRAPVARSNYNLPQG